eukprot:m.42629 g.42629  ORF g.42629 m.42629 type:complete len:762 (+) comp7068_c0_seq1:41-2326(+)
MSGEGDLNTSRFDGFEVFASVKADVLSGIKKLDDTTRNLQLSLGEWSRTLKQEGSFSDEVAEIIEQVSEIGKAVARDSMKVVFVGLTSAGKSTTINAMLGSRVLPTGFGHTTNRFISLFPTEEESAKLVDTATNESLRLDELDELANALSDIGVESDENEQELSELKLYWPVSKCELLQNDIVIHDSPGLSLTKGFDQWIENTVGDADVFVLVVNGEMALGVQATKFFEHVTKKVSRPNVFIVFNRWELAPTKCERVRNQLFHQARNLLVKQLGIYSEEELISRIFFVSAKEIVDYRYSDDADVKKVDTSSLGTDHLKWDNSIASRLKSFSMFESEFSSATSQHAIKTRFMSKVEESIKLASRCEKILDVVVSGLRSDMDNLEESLTTTQARLAEVTRKLHNTKTNSLEIAATVPMRIQAIIDSVTSDILSHELPKILRDHPSLCEFDTAESIAIEAVQLSEQLEASLKMELENRLSPQVLSIYDSSLQEISNSFQLLLADDENAHSSLRNSFRGNMTLDCSQLPHNFSPDVAFHFSWGWGAVSGFLPPSVRFMCETFADDASSRLRLSFNRLHKPSTDTQAIGEGKSTSSSMLQSATSFATDLGYILWDLSTSTPYGIAIATVLPYASTFVRKPWFRKLILGSAAAYGALYAFEYMSFTKDAKDRLFRSQFLAHSREKLEIAAASRARDAKDNAELDYKESIDSLCKKVEKNKLRLKETISKLETTLVHTSHLYDDAASMHKEIVHHKSTLQSLLFKHFQ